MKILTTDNLKTTPNWLDLVGALEKGHLYPRPQIDDVFQKDGPVTLLSRSGVYKWIWLRNQDSDGRFRK